MRIVASPYQTSFIFVPDMSVFVNRNTHQGLKLVYRTSQPAFSFVGIIGEDCLGVPPRL